MGTVHRQPSTSPSFGSSADDSPAIAIGRPGSTKNARCTVVIATRNRKEELEQAIRTSLAQTVPVEVIILDDASTDGTGEMVKRRFPMVRYERVESSLGYIQQRNRGATLATTDVIVSIDDDAAFPSPRTIEQTLAELADERVGAVGIPYIDVHRGDFVAQLAPDEHQMYILPAYVGTAHAIKRKLFLDLGGYRECHLHQGEEDDLGIRMLEASYLIRAGRADPIHHFESPKRDLTKLFRCNARNHVLYAWHNVPLAFLPLRLVGMTLNLLRWGWSKGYMRATISGLCRGYLDLVRGALDDREPVSTRSYKLMRYLQRNKPARLADVEGMWGAFRSPSQREGAGGWAGKSPNERTA